MNVISPVIEQHAFRDRDFVGGHMVVDFVNTVTGRNGHPRDWLASFAALADWAALIGLFPKHQCERLKKSSHRSPTEAESVLASARELRELLFKVLLALAVNGRSPSPGDLELLDAYWCRAVEKHTLRRVGGSIQPVIADFSAALDGIVNAMAIRAVDLMRELSTTLLRMCAGPNCAWLFIDSSKAGRRRWCDMATCGNDAKAKRHYLSKRKRTKTD
jgi:predicted RNA-binding Zn ribbon-like protein